MHQDGNQWWAAALFWGNLIFWTAIAAFALVNWIIGLIP